MKINCGDKLREVREKCGLSQTDVAKKLNLTRQAISSWEMNRTEPNMGNLTRLCNLYHCEISIFFQDDEDDIEMEIINAYRKSDAQTQRIVLYALHLEEYL